MEFNDGRIAGIAYVYLIFFFFFHNEDIHLVENETIIIILCYR